MKRLICFLLSLLLAVVPGIVVTADEGTLITQADVENIEPSGIMFRNIPWGTTYGDFLANYNEFGVDADREPAYSSLLTVPNSENSKISVYMNGYQVAEDGGAGFDVSVGHFSSTLCSVAGYNVNNISYSFIFSADADTGYVDLDKMNALLFMCEYNFEKMTDATAMVDDLIGKLSSIYGEIIDTDQDKLSDSTRNYYLWEDTDGNWIILSHNHRNDEPDSVYMKYYCIQIFDWMNQLTEAYAKEEADSFVAPEGTDGL